MQKLKLRAVQAEHSGLANTLGWKVVEDLPGTVSGIEGICKVLAGQIVSPTLKFTPDVEITVSHLIVIPSE